MSIFCFAHKQRAEHYKSLFERYMAESHRYQAWLYHAWRVIREQNKGLSRQARKIKRLNGIIQHLRENKP